ncbi:MAG: Glycine-tRNA ligase [Candidatus Campbellbacteria bacterium GW2011_GWD1_35_49]|nr:MAG: glycyl-tRNA synthetase, glycyl-tRNA synthetase [Candidatus Campbellbacteria bacterium GW2011_OD1_34_28]KKP75201.1 MAG: Glycine-tRNA ligase [Candidatus Campbellbacteria bacterium GW2011_GWD2_35_24]KKP76238.1 MAG: glycyl-tRNA synthetase, glycyl-tRNA synthetase [Candidatus Campbellbacteria bacterium GW2011_GWC2_35_28]KKP77427.1 MAG: Glycine-tRNA ligase [Candidatus Campbellbacteria bacterium GW2011_GWC1_35_31]KKP79356.1 MAG: Glycine-tRNA ligase [Candidatus Campbellbacteria bacterium GW2011_
MEKETEQNKMDKIISLAKRRGFVYQGSEIYGGLGGTYSYGPLGVELKNNIKQLWWKKFVQDRTDVVGIDGPILLHPKLWEASGHKAGFGDAMVDCKECKKRFRADHLVEEAIGIDMEGENEKMNQAIQENKIKCPACGKFNWTDVRDFNMMFKTEMNGVEESVFLRPETAGAIFIEFKNIIDSTRKKIPFGIAQIGKAFRNEIVAGNFIFRLREFEQMEIEYLIHPNMDWEPLFEEWIKLQEDFALELGAKREDLRRREHSKEKLSHYSKKTVDIEYNFPFGGFKELFGLAHRGDFDLTQHSKYSNEKLEYFDQDSGERFTPHIIEPTFGVERSLLMTLISAYNEEEVEGEMRVVLKLPKKIAPVKVAILPLSKKEELTKPTMELFNSLKNSFVCQYDETQSIGKRYRRQDEIGTPFCITFDFDSLNDLSVTVRDRDTMKQDRVKIEEVESYLKEKLK